MATGITIFYCLTLRYYDIMTAYSRAPLEESMELTVKKELFRNKSSVSQLKNIQGIQNYGDVFVL